MIWVKRYWNIFHLYFTLASQNQYLEHNENLAGLQIADWRRLCLGLGDSRCPFFGTQTILQIFAKFCHWIDENGKSAALFSLVTWVWILNPNLDFFDEGKHQFGQLFSVCKLESFQASYLHFQKSNHMKMSVRSSDCSDLHFKLKLVLYCRFQLDFFALTKLIFQQ